MKKLPACSRATIPPQVRRHLQHLSRKSSSYGALSINLADG
jgi:hypothetical protein